MQSVNASSRSVASNAVSGAKVGLIMALLLCAWVVVLALLSGSTTIRFRHGESVSVVRILALYLLACPTLGAVLGAMRNLMRYLPVAIVTGIVAATPLAFMIGLTVDGKLPTDREGLLTVAFFALTFGAGGGFVLHKALGSAKSASA